MKQVEIVTSQNVVIQYPLANIIDRALAFLIDIFLVSTGVLIIVFITKVFPLSVTNEEIISFMVIIIFSLFYHLFMESFGGGRSFGKKAMSIKPIKQNGEQMVFSDCLMRWVFRLPDIMLSLGTLAIISISSSSKSQRLGDFLAGTVVIKTADIKSPQLNQVLKINKQQESYKPTYPDVLLLSDKDIILIKEVLYRKGKFNNEASKTALLKITRKAGDILQIKVPVNKVQFLKDLIKDYVFLTR